MTNSVDQGGTITNPNQPPALGVGTGLPNNQPILMNPTQPTTNSGVLSNTANNARSFTYSPISDRPDFGIGTNEMLMRVGGAGLEGAQKSGLQSYANMLNTYGGIQDQRRANAASAYELDYRAEKDQRRTEPWKNTSMNSRKIKGQQGMPQSVALYSGNA